uniref:Conserved oligomeric Golgi complex subunit 3 n=1 Tax=Tabanus bromius TaxID=304241 RepID=A0A0K8TSY1_TABBR
MNDITSLRLENDSFKKICNKLLLWDVKDAPLAPVSSVQQNTITFLDEIFGHTEEGGFRADHEKGSLAQSINLCPSNAFVELYLGGSLDTTNDFLAWYDSVESEMYYYEHAVFSQYLNQLLVWREECDKVLSQIQISLSKLDELKTEFEFVSNKTASMNSASEKLMEEQVKLINVSEAVHKRLQYFMNFELLHQRLSSPTLSVTSDVFRQCLNKIDDCLEYLANNVKFKESSAYILKYKQCLLRAVALIRAYVATILSRACQQILSPDRNTCLVENGGAEAAFALYYGKFQSAAAKVQLVTSMIEERNKRSNEYQQLLVDLQNCYLSERANIMSPAVNKAIIDLKSCHKGDHCSFIRSACAFLVHVSLDEYRLFHQFFSGQSSELHSYLEGICIILYDTLRPYVIHVNHLETLAETCSILKIEMLEEHVQQSPESLQAFAKICLQLLQDVQERLVFRAHIYLQSDILNYKPSLGDLAYPEKLEMMENIALSLQNVVLQRSESKSSVESITTLESEALDGCYPKSINSPADLHGMWYPTVRRTLVCLSRLYRCVDRHIFQGLSQEALKYCIQSIISASAQISSAKGNIDGELFQIKHLLILREQIAPFRVDFTVKETSLDFTKIKTAAFGLLQKRKQLFSLGTNNALLEFLLEGTTQVREHLLDSRKDVDRQLKTICEQFIKDAVQMLVGPISTFLEKAQNLLSSSSIEVAAKGNFVLREKAWASPQHISSLVQESQRLVKNKLAALQRSMQLYLSNRDTEFIIFRPIRNSVIGAFLKLEQLLTTNGYSSNDMIMTGCPSAEQVSILLSSASILAENSSKLRKMSSTSTDKPPSTDQC